MNIHPIEIDRNISNPRKAHASILAKYSKSSESPLKDSQIIDGFLEILNDSQKEIYNSMLEHVRNFFIVPEQKFAEHQIITIDANPGTGKSFLISCFIQSLNINPLYLIYSHNLLALMKAHRIDAQTISKFLISLTGANFYKSKYLFSGEILKILDNLCKMLKADLIPNKIIILDEYSVTSPWLLAFLIIHAVKYKKLLIFLGDKYQQKSLQCHSSLKFSNDILLNHFSKMFGLCKNMRQKDPIFQRKIDLIKHWIINDRKLEANHKKQLSQIFRDKFMLEDDFTLPFLTTYHKNIKERLIDLCKSIPHQKSFYESRNGKRMPENSKFLNYLPLIPNQRYIYMKNNVKILVVLKQWNKNQIIIKTESGQLLLIKKQPCNSKNTLSAKLELVKNYWQFPIHLPFFTYHSVQGLTLNFNSIDIDLKKAKSLNGIYVAFSRVMDENQIHKIYIEESFLEENDCNPAPGNIMGDKDLNIVWDKNEKSTIEDFNQKHFNGCFLILLTEFILNNLSTINFENGAQKILDQYDFLRQKDCA